MTTSARCCPGAGKTLYRSSSGRNRWGWWSAYELATGVRPAAGMGDAVLSHHLGIAFVAVGDQATGVVTQQAHGHPAGSAGIIVEQHHLLARRATTLQPHVGR